MEGVLGMLTIKLRDDNFAKWALQFQYVLRGYKLFGHFDGTIVWPPKYVVSTEVGVTKEISGALGVYKHGIVKPFTCHFD
ncbi:hypothetical protein EV2_038031 [Malus domestica]